MPAMSEEDIGRIRRWHEAAYQGILAEAGTDGTTYEYLNRQIDGNGFTRETVATDGLERDGVRVDYVTYRVRPRSVTT